MRDGRESHRVIMALFLVVLATLINVQCVAAYGMAAHAALAKNALWLYDQTGTHEIDQYFPIFMEGVGATVNGVDVGEDYHDHIYDSEGQLVTLGHFWDADKGPDDEVSFWDFASSDNAWQKARQYFGMAVGQYRSGNKPGAYMYLGHAAHLLGDMSVPAHAHEDAHCFDEDTYDDTYMSSNNGHNAEITSSEQRDLNTKAGPDMNPPGVDDELYYLFYTTNQVADFFPSDDADADRDGNYGGWMNGVNGVYTKLGMDSVTWPTTSGDMWNEDSCRVIRQYSYFYAIRSTAELFRYFEQEVKKDDWLTVVIENVYPKDDHGNWLYFDDPELYVTLYINNARYTNEGDMIHNAPVGYWIVPPPHWAFARKVGDTGLVDVCIQLWDDDYPFGDDKSDLDHFEGRRDLDFQVDLESGAITGDVKGYWGNILHSEGHDNERSAIEFQVLSMPPKVTSIGPSYGYQGDDDAMVHIYGTRFIPGSQVWLSRTGYESIPARGNAVKSPDEITCYFTLDQNMEVGLWNVEVVNPDGQSSLKENSFTIVAPLKFKSFEPKQGIKGTTVRINITGTGFRPGATVKLGGVGAGIPGNIIDFGPNKIVADFMLKVATDPGPWDYNIEVMNLDPGGNEGSSIFGRFFSAGPFKAYSPLTIADVTPNTGKRSKTASFLINGTGFQPGVNVSLSKKIAIIIGGQPVGEKWVYIRDIDADLMDWMGADMNCTFLVPETAATGAWNVIVENPDGQRATLSDGFIIAAQPSIINSIWPIKGTAGTTVSATINGTNFRYGSHVKLYRALHPTGPKEPAFASIPAVIIQWPGNTKEIGCTFDLPSWAYAGAWNVIVTGPDGQSVSLPGSFTVHAQPTATSISPKAGNAGTTVSATLTGTNFLSGASVKIFQKDLEILATSVDVVSPKTINCTFTLPLTAAKGSWSVVVANPDRLSATLNDGFTVVAPLTVASIIPNASNAGATITATITGTGFLPGEEVIFLREGRPIMEATNVTVVSTTEIQCTLALPPWMAIGKCDMVVGIPYVVTTSLPGGFTILPPPSIESVEPNQGVQGTTVKTTITGTEFTSGATVTLTRRGSLQTPALQISAIRVVVVSPKVIDCIFNVPSNAPTGGWNVLVTNPGGASGSLPGGFIILPLQTLEISTMDPDMGAPNTTVLATIKGTGFVPGSTVNLVRDGSPSISANEVTIESTISINCMFEVPLDAAIGPWNIRVDKPSGGSTTQTNGFTIDPSALEDAIPPASIKGLNCVKNSNTNILWGWVDPDDPDFSMVRVYLNGVFKDTVPKGNGSYLATGLLLNTPYTIGTQTEDMFGNTNQTWVNQTVWTTTSSSSLTVGKPNGGERWAQGSTYPIVWRYAGIIDLPGNENPDHLSSTVKIELLKADVINQVINASVPIGSKGLGTYRWTIPYNQERARDYKVRVSSTGNAVISDTSNVVFSIIAGKPITVTAPNGGENWKLGSPHTIQWKYTGNPGPKVKIEILNGTAVNRVISANTSIGSGGTGSKTWTIPLKQSLGSDFRIRVTSKSKPKSNDTSNDPFTISTQ